MTFQTDYKYNDRETKAKYVWLKYSFLLEGRILDVGADQCHLRQYLAPSTRYTGIGLGGNPDLLVNLERGSLPFCDDSFDCVLCLDVLEHVDNPHAVFDELCRVSRKYVIIALPNPWSAFLKTLTRGEFAPGQPLKFYGLPVEPPEDRHKWFFSAEEASRFVTYRAAANNFRILQVDHEGGRPKPFRIRRALKNLAWDYLFRGGMSRKALFAGSLWAVLEASPSEGSATHRMSSPGAERLSR